MRHDPTLLINILAPEPRPMTAVPTEAIAAIESTLTFTRKGARDSATYLVLRDGKPTDFAVLRNDNEAGHPDLACPVRRAGLFQ